MACIFHFDELYIYVPEVMYQIDVYKLYKHDLACNMMTKEGASHDVCLK